MNVTLLRALMHWLSTAPVIIPISGVLFLMPHSFLLDISCMRLRTDTPDNHCDSL
jgi:hypothetical protein